MIGQVAYAKGSQELSPSYDLTGFTPAEFTIRATGVQLEKVGREK